MNIELSKARLLIHEASVGDSVDGARVIADAVEMVDCPTIESYAGGASEGGVGSRVTIRINGALVEYAPVVAHPPSLLAAARQVESWWVEGKIGEQLGGAPACMFNLRAAITAPVASRAGSEVALTEDEIHDEITRLKDMLP